MSFHILKPSAVLAPYIKMYWTLENSLKSTEKHIQRIVPSGLPEITFYLDDIPETITNNGFLGDRTIISGQKNNYHDLLVKGKTKLFSILFQPFGLSRFIDIPISEIFNKTVPFQFLPGIKTAQIEEKLFEAKTVKEQKTIIEDFLIQLLHKKQNHQLPRIAGSLDHINESNCENSIQKLASGACLSRKQFERTFNNLIGISPKQFYNIIRFQRAIFLKQTNPKIKLTALAFDAGYYDQSHMIAEFKLFSGNTPKQFFNQCEPVSDYFSTF